MTASVKLNNDILLSINSCDELVVSKQGKDLLLLSNGNIIDCAEQSSSKAAKEFIEILLKAEFAIPENMQIKKLKTSTKDDKNTKIYIEANSKNDSIDINCQLTPQSSMLERKIKKQASNKEKNETNDKYNQDFLIREYSESTVKKYDFGGDKEKENIEKTINRSVNKNGKSLSMHYFAESSDSFSPEFSEQRISIEISSTEISKSIVDINQDHKRKLKITYNMKTNAIKCMMEETEYNKYVHTEYSSTILNLLGATKKKVATHTPFDRNFKASLIIDGDGNTTYHQQETMPDMSEKKTEASSLDKVCSLMLKELETIKSIASTVAILRNSQNQAANIDFSKHSGIFDDYIGFSSVKNKENVEILSNLTRESTNNAHFLALKEVIKYLDKKENNSSILLASINER